MFAKKHATDERIPERAHLWTPAGLSART